MISSSWGVLAGFGAQPWTSHVALAECILAKYFKPKWWFAKVLHVAGVKWGLPASGEDAGSGDIPLPRSLTRCARSFGCGERCRLTNGAEIYFLVDARKKLNRDTIRPRQSRFSIGSAPLTSITKSDAQISGGETRQDYKDTRRFPLVAPSCALLFPSCGIRVVVEALPKSPRPVPFRQFAPSWAVCKNPPFSPTAAPFPVTIVLSPTRKDTT